MAPFKVADSDIAAMLVVARESSAAASNPRLSHQDRVEAAGRYLQAIADLHAAGSVAEGVQRVEVSLAEEAVRALDPESLQQAADEIDELLSDVAEDPYLKNLAERAELLMQHLAVRDRAGRRLEGAKLLGLSTELNEEQREAFDYFESVVRPMAWAMAFANEERVAKVRRIAPANRKASWWWCEGTDIDWKAVQLVTETAELLARYPSFGRHLDRTVQAARARRAMMQSTARATQPRDVAARTAQVRPMEVEFELPAEVAEGKFANIPQVDLGADAQVFIGRNAEGFVLRVRGQKVREVTATDPNGRAFALKQGRLGMWCVLGPELPESVLLNMKVGDRAVARRITFRRS